MDHRNKQQQWTCVTTSEAGERFIHAPQQEAKFAFGKKYFLSDGLMFGSLGKQKPLVTKAAQQTGSLSSPLMVFQPFIEHKKKNPS